MVQSVNVSLLSRCPSSLSHSPTLPACLPSPTHILGQRSQVYKHSVAKCERIGVLLGLQGRGLLLRLPLLTTLNPNKSGQAFTQV